MRGREREREREMGINYSLLHTTPLSSVKISIMLSILPPCVLLNGNKDLLGSSLGVVNRHRSRRCANLLVYTSIIDKQTSSFRLRTQALLAHQS